MREEARVIVGGGGIVGCSVLYGLARRGWVDTLLLERLDPTSVSTWHAAGNVTHFGHYAGLTRLYVDSIRTYLEAEAEGGHCVGFHETGSLRLATSRAGRHECCEVGGDVSTTSPHGPSVLAFPLAPPARYSRPPCSSFPRRS